VRRNGSGLQEECRGLPSGITGAVGDCSDGERIGVRRVRVNCSVFRSQSIGLYQTSLSEGRGPNWDFSPDSGFLQLGFFTTVQY